MTRPTPERGSNRETKTKHIPLDNQQPRPRRCHGDQGAMTTELVLITPVFFTMMLFLVQVGLWLHAVNVASTAAQEAAAVARAQGGTEAAAEARGNDFLARTSLRLWVAPPNVDVTFLGGTAETPDEARAEVTGVIAGIMPWVDFTVVEASQGPVESFRGPGEEQDP